MNAISKQSLFAQTVNTGRPDRDKDDDDWELNFTDLAKIGEPSLAESCSSIHVGQELAFHSW